MVTTSTRPPGPGRPRRPGHDEKILEATLRLIDTDRRITVNAVVEESGVSRAAVYRRWSSMTDLIASALDQGRATPVIDTDGDIKSALIEVLYTRTTVSQTLGETYTTRRFRKRLELMMSDQDLQRAYWRSHVAPRRASPIEALKIARDRGEIRADVDVEAALDAMYGAFYYQIVVRGENLSEDRTLDRCIEAFELIWAGMQ